MRFICPGDEGRGVDVLATANNHAVDNFKTGITRTISVLAKMGIRQLGTYVSAEDREERRVLITEKKGLRIALLNFTYTKGGILFHVEYEVVSVELGEFPLTTILVANGYSSGGRLSGAARREIGTQVRLSLVPLSTYPALSNWTMIGGVAEGEGAMFYTPKLK